LPRKNLVVKYETLRQAQGDREGQGNITCFKLRVTKTCPGKPLVPDLFRDCFRIGVFDSGQGDKIRFFRNLL